MLRVGAAAAADERRAPNLPSLIYACSCPQVLRAAYCHCYYCAITSVPLLQLMNDAPLTCPPFTICPSSALPSLSMLVSAGAVRRLLLLLRGHVAASDAADERRALNLPPFSICS